MDCFFGLPGDLRGFFVNYVEILNGRKMPVPDIIRKNTPVPDIIRKKWVINLSSKPLSDGEQSILQKGPKFAVSSSEVPITEYIAHQVPITEYADSSPT